MNNAVYVAYAEEVATLHAEAIGFGRAWTLSQGGTWVVRRHEIMYLAAATAGDELELRTEIEALRGARAVRHTTIRFVTEARLATDVRTEWVWVRSDGRPGRVPAEVIAAFEAE